MRETQVFVFLRNFLYFQLVKAATSGWQDVREKKIKEKEKLEEEKDNEQKKNDVSRSRGGSAFA